MSKGDRSFDVIAILSADACSLQYPGFFKFCEDVLDGAFGDSHLECYFAEGNGGILRQHDEDVGMVGEECPAWRF